mmetsp:Transcript_2569/g.5837  ORF Transcript_2569/g.5837 Transcript_2569/m.5837 type:complete len:94 (+) Transcript_2569:47-328(+)
MRSRSNASSTLCRMAAGSPVTRHLLEDITQCCPSFKALKRIRDRADDVLDSAAGQFHQSPKHAFHTEGGYFDKTFFCKLVNNVIDPTPVTTGF